MGTVILKRCGRTQIHKLHTLLHFFRVPFSYAPSHLGMHMHKYIYIQKFSQNSVNCSLKLTLLIFFCKTIAINMRKEILVALKNRYMNINFHTLWSVSLDRPKFDGLLVNILGTSTFTDYATN